MQQVVGVLLAAGVCTQYAYHDTMVWRCHLGGISTHLRSWNTSYLESGIPTLGTYPQYVLGLVLVLVLVYYGIPSVVPSRPQCIWCTGSILPTPGGDDVYTLSVYHDTMVQMMYLRSWNTSYLVFWIPILSTYTGYSIWWYWQYLWYTVVYLSVGPVCPCITAVCSGVPTHQIWHTLYTYLGYHILWSGGPI